MYHWSKFNSILCFSLTCFFHSSLSLLAAVLVGPSSLLSVCSKLLLKSSVLSLNFICPSSIKLNVCLLMTSTCTCIVTLGSSYNTRIVRKFFITKLQKTIRIQHLTTKGKFKALLNYQFQQLQFVQLQFVQLEAILGLFLTNNGHTEQLRWTRISAIFCLSLLFPNRQWIL